MPRRTRKQIVGKIENREIREREVELGALEQLLHREWWSQQRGQVTASEVLPLYRHAQRER